MSLTSPQRYFAIAAVIVVVVAGAALGWRHLHEGHRHEHGTAALSLDNGKRWPTDAPQRAGMQQIREGAVAVQAAFVRGQLGGDAAKSFAEAVNARFGEMVKACKLSPKADATFHVILTELMRGAALLATNPQSQEGMTAVTKALRQYPEYFDHAGWVPLPDAGA